MEKTLDELLELIKEHEDTEIDNTPIVRVTHHDNKTKEFIQTMWDIFKDKVTPIAKKVENLIPAQ